MYISALLVHSWLRWIVILAGLLAFAGAIAGWRARRRWSPSDGLAARVFVATLDLQFLVGLLLYIFLSPIVGTARADMGAAMADSVSRFWIVEHVAAMIIATALAHIGQVRGRRLGTDARRHRATAIFVGLALVALAVGIPWPGLPYARPLFRFGM